MKELADVNRGGALNDGYDDLNYDYILHGDEIFAKRYILKHRIGKVREGTGSRREGREGASARTKCK